MDHADLDELVEQDADPVFDQAAEFLKQHHNHLTPDELLELYAAYKQGTEGDCTAPKPGIFQIQGRAKWYAWTQQRGVSKAEARLMYVNILTAKFPAWRSTDLQPGPAVSRFAFDDAPDDADWTIADFVKANSPDLKAHLATLKASEVNELDESGMALIHWCADRGHTDALRLLLSHPHLDVNLRDVDGQTALHYASSCGHQECLRILKEAGADTQVRDEDGKTFEEVAFDAAVRQFIQTL